tara:strand:+ start:963 stop:1430 length:468 start_codon:yes stop_codon:yes gene_type:complete
MIRKTHLLIILILLSQCGFKIVDNSLSTFNISSVEIEGYNKVNFLVKNDLLSKVDNSKEFNKISISMETNRKKEISEKNIRNEITKYKISINTKVQIFNSNNEREKTFNISKNGDYRVGSTSLQTSKNQDNLEKMLSEEISKEIKQQLFFLSNDL